MITRRDDLSTHVENGRYRRKKRARWGSQIASGRPAEVSLRSVVLNPEQKEALSVLQAQTHDDQEDRLATPKRLALLISLGFHFIAALIGTLYIVKTAAIDDDAIFVDFMYTKASKVPRRLPPRQVTRIQVYPFQRVERPWRRKSVTTAVKLPQSDAWRTPPGDTLSSVDDRELVDGEAGLNADGLNRKLPAGAHRAQIESVIPDINPHKSASSIFDKIARRTVLEENFELDPVEPSPVEPTEFIRRPSWRQKVEPKYPDFARRAQKEGVVVVGATIDIDGLAKDIRVIEGIGFGCDKAAIDALKASRFAPAKRGETIIALRIQIPYRFELQN